MVKCDAMTHQRCENAERTTIHRLHAIFVHICFDCSPTNLLTNRWAFFRMCRSVYIYDFENSTPYFYVHFFSSSFWQHKRYCQHHSLPTASYFAANTRFSDDCDCVSLFIHSLCGVWHSVWLIRSSAVLPMRNTATRATHSKLSFSSG